MGALRGRVPGASVTAGCHPGSPGRPRTTSSSSCALPTPRWGAPPPRLAQTRARSAAVSPPRPPGARGCQAVPTTRGRRGGSRPHLLVQMHHVRSVEEAVLSHFFHCRPRRWVCLQQLAHEVRSGLRKRGRERVADVEAHDLTEQVPLLLRPQRRPPREQLVDDAAQRPHVRCQRRRVAAHHLGGQVLGGPLPGGENDARQRRRRQQRQGPAAAPRHGHRPERSPWGARSQSRTV